MLKEEKIDAEVINARFLKPLDKETITKSIEKTKFVITLEDGTIIDGLGTAVKELIIDNDLEDVKVKSYAYPDKFIKHGAVEELEELYHQDAKSIYDYIILFFGTGSKNSSKEKKKENKEKNKKEEE